MVGAGVSHFTSPAFFLAIVPKVLPSPELVVSLSGVAEIALGLGLMVPRTRNLAAWSLMLFFVLVFPANVYMAMYEITPPGAPPMPSWGPWARLPLQGLLIYWAYLFTDRHAQACATRKGKATGARST